MDALSLALISMRPQANRTTHLTLHEMPMSRPMQTPYFRGPVPRPMTSQGGSSVWARWGTRYCPTGIRDTTERGRWHQETRQYKGNRGGSNCSRWSFRHKLHLNFNPLGSTDTPMRPNHVTDSRWRISEVQPQWVSVSTCVPSNYIPVFKLCW